ncbi:sensor histidine kinase [Rheinheimera riviphila]|uniref:histidine kinase n=1 Tax=Rheinheimera riviphila TaxID=1834037 RepID=A0A437R303_9GAMM|nr:sensor histidine kinase [Rheinheimera riviphila]RVU41125.1 sensor histidine kinase [Rheinheimera riviphila]
MLNSHLPGLNWIHKLFCLLITLTFYSSVTFGYTDFKRIGVDDGLPNATIYSVAQDQHGYIWLTSTNSGLLRYDGYNFSEFPLLTASEMQHLGHQDVGVLLIDRENNIWAGTWGYGLSRIDALTGQLSRYVVDKNSDQGIAGMQVQALFQDRAGYLWIGTTGGLNRLSPDGKMSRIGAANSAQPLKHQRIWSLQQTADGTVWIGTAEGLHCWHEQTGLCPVALPYPNAATGSRDNEIRALTTSQNTLWIGTRLGLFSLDATTGNITPVPVAESMTTPIINHLLFDSDGNLLLGTYNGLFRYNPQQRKFLKFRKQDSLLPTVNVRSMFIDRTGVLWLGSRENGLFYARHSASAFSSLTSLLPGEPAGDLGFTVTAVFSEGDVLWLGSAEYLYRIDRKLETMQRYQTSGRVNTIRRDPQGQVFAATDVGLFRYDPPSDALQRIDQPFTLAKARNDNVRDLVINEQGQFWLGLWGEGVLYWDPATQQSQLLLREMIQQKVGDAVQALYQQGDFLWVGTRYSGLFQLTISSGAIRHLSADQASGLVLPSQDVQCVEKGPADSILICTEQGLVVYQPQTLTQQLWDGRSGLLTHNIVGAHTDADSNVWLLSAKGLTLKPAGSSRFITFTRQDGLVATELVFKAIFNDQSGSIYIGTIAGLAIVEPELLWVNELPPTVAVPEILINHQPLPMLAHSNEWPSIVLKPTDSSVEFKFASLDYHDVSRNQFLYRLRGFDSDWILQSDKRAAYYSNLPAGDYVLEVKGSNNHGLFSDKTVEIQLQVLPSWWQYRTVQVLVGIVTLLLILAGHQYRLRHVRQINRLLQNSVQERSKAQLILETKVAERTSALEESSLTLSLRSKQLEKSLQEVAKANRELKRLDKLKDEFISVVSHELRTPLTSIRGAVGLIAQRVVEPGSDPYQLLIQTAVNNCERLSSIINDLLDVQKFEAGKFVLQLKPVDLVDLVQQAISASNAYAHKYQVSVTLQADLATPLTVNVDALRIRQVVDNLLSNAIKFSHQGGAVLVELCGDELQVKVAITDQGVGIPESFHTRVFDKFSQADASDSRTQEGTGLGLTICKKIIESHQGQIGFVSQEQQGSCFWVTLPRLQSLT